MTYILGQNTAAATDFGITVTGSSFNKDVVEASLQKPVVVLFTLSRDANCKKFDSQLTTLLKDYSTQIQFARADVADQSLLMLLQRFGMQGVPAVFVLSGGQMLDGFAGMMPERELKTFFSALLGKPQRSSSQLYADAEKYFFSGDYVTTSTLCNELISMLPDDVKATCLLAECFMELNQLDQGEALLQTLSPTQQIHVDSARARNRLAFLRRLSSVADTTTDAVEQGLLLARNHQHQAACEHLLNLVKNPDTKKSAAEALHDIFTVLGADSTITMQYRKKLTQLLF